MTIKDVTLATIDGINPELAAKTLKHCAKLMPFGEVILLSFRKPKCSLKGIRFIQIPQLSYREYAQFCIRDLWQHITKTSHVLTIHPDGYILNPDRWQDDWLNYDYIGAPWPKGWGTGHQVGNSGFCLRSIGFLMDCSTLIHQWTGENDDVFMCQSQRVTLEAWDNKYAPAEVAACFSLEHEVPGISIPPTDTFGFHGFFSHPALRKLL